MSGKPVTLEDNTFTYGEYSWPKDAPSAFKSLGNVKYTMHAFWYFMQKMGIEHSAYILEAKNAGIQAVSRSDRKMLVSYLTGETNTYDKIDASVYVPLAGKHGDKSAAKRPAEDAADDAAAKRAKQDDVKPREATESDIARVVATGVITKEKISEIKAKKLAHKLQAKGAEEDIKEKTTQQRQKDAEVTREIAKYEKVYQTRRTVLDAPGKGFADVVTLLATLKEEKKRAEAKTSVAVAPVSDKYDRWAQKGTDKISKEFNIDTKGSNIQSKFPAMPVPIKEQPPVAAAATPKSQNAKKPIIIVPAGTRSLITMYNVKEFLETRKFVPSQQAEHNAKPSQVIIQRKKGADTFTYKVIDNVATMLPEHWDRVVAVFVAGPAWQFKDWPKTMNDNLETSNPVNIFNKVKAFYVTFSGSDPDPNVKKWNVTTIDVSRTQRHLDTRLVSKVWEEIDHLIATKKPHLEG